MSVYQGDNPEHFQLAIDSIFNQTQLPDQLVLVVDGPIEDKVSDKIHGYQNQYDFLTVHVLPENVGLIKALNSGLDLCQHPLVFRMDSDDIADVNRIRLQSEFMATHPEVTLLGTQMTDFTISTEHPLPSKIMPLGHEEIQSKLPWRNPINHPTVCFRRDAVLEVGGYPDLEFLEDYLLWCLLISKGHRCHNLDRSLLYYRFDDGTLTRRSGTKNFTNEVKLRRWLLDNNLCSTPVFVITCLMQLVLRYAPITLKRYLWRRSREQP